LEVNPALIGPTLAFLDDLASEVHLVWFGPRIEPHKNFAKILELSYRCDLEKVALDENVRETFVRMDGYLKQVSAGHHFRYISQVDAIKFDERHDIYDCSAAFWADGDHWSRAGDEYFGKRFASSLLAE
jgi:hypothetical protein